MSGVLGTGVWGEERGLGLGSDQGERGIEGERREERGMKGERRKQWRIKEKEDIANSSSILYPVM